ncbi:hypothetical protein JW905_16910 [bacterium]|nr:hypothetical protein [candidate division CSSED10-310 bacterium]
MNRDRGGPVHGVRRHDAIERPLPPAPPPQNPERLLRLMVVLRESYCTMHDRLVRMASCDRLPTLAREARRCLKAYDELLDRIRECEARLAPENNDETSADPSAGREQSCP